MAMPASHRGRNTAILVGSLGLAILLLFLGRYGIRSPQFKGQKVTISKGDIPVMEFLRVLADFTGLPLLYDSSDQTLAQKTITIANDITGADEEVVKAILEVNRVRVVRESLPGGRVVLKVERLEAGAPGQWVILESDSRSGAPAIYQPPSPPPSARR